jgi:hypothetical protein
MQMKALYKGIIFLFLYGLVTLVLMGSSRPAIPVTASTLSSGTVDLYLQNDKIVDKNSRNQNTIPLDEFIRQAMDGDEHRVRGVYIKDKFNFLVVDQPRNRPSSIENVVTHFQMASKNNVTGLIAHNYLAGSYFFDIQVGDRVSIVNGDGSVFDYIVTDIQKYQALQPDNPRSTFHNLESKEKLSATELFERVYTGSHHVTFQTCIWKGDVDTWGRLFVIAEPI